MVLLFKILLLLLDIPRFFFKKTIGLELTEEEEVIFDSVQAAPEA